MTLAYRFRKPLAFTMFGVGMLWAATSVARADAYVSFFVDVECFHDEGSDGEQGFDPSVLQYATLDHEESMRVRDVDLGQYKIQRP